MTSKEENPNDIWGTLGQMMKGDGISSFEFKWESESFGEVFKEIGIKALPTILNSLQTLGTKFKQLKAGFNLYSVGQAVHSGLGFFT